ncbi:MAG: Gfo/Idh/MocA family oxidoreductase, partial [Candidatus Paceibacterota bacterium]
MKVKVIGAGSIGNHLSQAARRMGWDVSVVDRDQEALRRMKEDIFPSRYGAWDEKIQLFDSANEPKGGFDVICIGTPPDVRLHLALQALEEKPKVLLLEKPLFTPDFAEREEFADFMNQVTKPISPTTVLAGYDHAVSAAIDFVSEMLRESSIGEVQTLDVEFRENWEGIFKAHRWLKGPADSYLGFT